MESKKLTHGYQNCNMCQIFIFDGYVKVKDECHIFILFIFVEHLTRFIKYYNMTQENPLQLFGCTQPFNLYKKIASM